MGGRRTSSAAHDLLDACIRDAGFRPVERNTRVRILREYPGPDPDRRESPQPMRV
ncbi:aminofutalosine synthase MqnE [Streptomyces californicus]